MPVHDWTRVSAGTFHDFHNSWIIHIKESLNNGLLPEDYYAQAEQRMNDIVADILTLRQPRGTIERPAPEGGVAVADAPPQVSTTMVPGESHTTGLKQRRVVVRHVTKHDVVAVVEIVSPANKDRPSTTATFVQKAVDAIQAGVHMLIVDLFPPGRVAAAGPAEGLAERAGQDVDAIHYSAMLVRPAAAWSHEADRVRVVDHNEGVVLVSQVGDHADVVLDGLEGDTPRQVVRAR